jgi:hypothetical protein
MAEQLAKVEFGKIFLKSFKRELESMRDEALLESAPILRREVETSIRERWYRLGRTLNSLEDDVIVDGNTKIYRLIPTAAHAPFGEWGTGRRGAATGEPAPTGWTYGDKPGMAARRFSRVAVERARPQVEDVWRLKVRELAVRLTR